MGDSWKGVHWGGLTKWVHNALARIYLDKISSRPKQNSDALWVQLFPKYPPPGVLAVSHPMKTGVVLITTAMFVPSRGEKVASFSDGLHRIPLKLTCLAKT